MRYHHTSTKEAKLRKISHTGISMANIEYIDRNPSTPLVGMEVGTATVVKVCGFQQMYSVRHPPPELGRQF